MTDLHGHDREGYSEDVKDRLLEMIASGDHGGVKTICRTYPDEMPAWNTVFCWTMPSNKLYSPKFHKDYLEAKRMVAHNFVDTILEDHGKLLRGEIDSRQAAVMLSQVDFISKKLSPNDYGDRRQLDHTSSDGSMTQTFASMYGKPAPEA